MKTKVDKKSLPDKSIMRVNGVYKSFPIRNHTIEVLKDIHLTIHVGEVVAITGASGSGKSTFLNLLAGIDSPTRGDIYFLKNCLNHMSESKLALLRSENVGFVFQQHNLIKELTVLENVLLPGMVQPNFFKNRKAKTEYAKRLLNKVGLSERLNHFVGELSGGEAQRVAIVRAFLNQPKLIFADEPTGNLDSKNSLDIFKLLKMFASTQSASVVMVTHSQELASKCDRVYHLSGGNLTLQNNATSVDTKSIKKSRV